MNYVYTVKGYLAVSLPYRPLYEFCDFVDANKYQVYSEIPKIEPGFTRTYSLNKGWSEPIAVASLPEQIILNITKVQTRLMIYHNLLNFENSCKLRYIPVGYGTELMYTLMEQDDSLLLAYAKQKKSTVEAVKEELKLRRQEIINLFIFLLETKQIVLDFIEKEQYNEAMNHVRQEIQRLNI